MATKTKKIKLQTPIVRGDTEIKEITLRKPTPGELRGISLAQLLSCEVDALIQVVPRISDPALITSEVENMDIADFSDAGDTIIRFLISNSTAAALRTK